MYDITTQKYDASDDLTEMLMIIEAREKKMDAACVSSYHRIIQLTSLLLANVLGIVM